MKRNYILLFFILLLITYNCSSFKKFFPIESITYPIFGNGYDITIYVKIKCTNGYITKGAIKPEVRAWQREKYLVFESIKIFNLENILIAEYTKEYLDKEREKVKVGNEFWIAYEGGLVLIPEEYHKGDDWQEYIKTIKGK